MNCTKCKSTNITQERKHNATLAIVLGLMGLLLAPFWVGIPMLIVGFAMSLQKIPADQYRCKTCQNVFTWAAKK